MLDLFRAAKVMNFSGLTKSMNENLYRDICILTAKTLKPYHLSSIFARFEVFGCKKHEHRAHSRDTYIIILIRKDEIEENEWLVLSRAEGP